MSRYIVRELERAVERPSRQELLERIASLPEVDLEPSPAEILRAERDSR